MSKNMYAPPYAAFISFRGNKYQADATGLIANVLEHDVMSLAAAGCTVFNQNGPASTGWTQQQYFAQATLTDAASIDWDLNTQQAAKVTLGGNRTLANPTNMKAGATYTLIVVQDGTGTRTLAYGNAFKWPGGTVPTLSTAIGAIDVLTFLSDGTNMLGAINKAFA